MGKGLPHTPRGKEDSEGGPWWRSFQSSGCELALEGIRIEDLSQMVQIGSFRASMNDSRTLRHTTR